MDMPSDPIEVVRRVVANDNARNRAGYRALLWDDYRAEVHGVVTVTSGDAEAEGLAHYWAGFPDGRVVEEAIHAAGNVVTLRYRLVGTNSGALAGRPATGRRVDVAGCTLLEVIDGRVKRTWRYLDTQGFAQQLGLAPAGVA
jgi:predicted ester cyclase